MIDEAKALELMAKAGLPAPEYITEGVFSTILYKLSPTSSGNVGENVGENSAAGLKASGKRLAKILDIMHDNPRISSMELSKILNVAERTIDRDIARLRESGKLSRKGGDKGGEWIVLE